ncbi:MAG: TIGR03617 family F420-dependent LLM class oxidoreductase [Chloroflexi bacterium]|nr:TIGR03617 family F420-dependent LLM class oxidoreductase [Chloroflexota bacterium]
MKIDTGLGVASFGDVAARAHKAEALGFDALWSSETQHDPFLPLALAAEHTSRIQLGTSIALAFPRSPMTLAYIGWDLQKMSRGRFIMGLGTQVKPHIERRFGIAWDHPTPRLREYILAMRHTWHCWQTGERLNFRGEFFKLTLMSPFFSPGPLEHPHVPIYISGVNEHLCRLAGELCEGFHVHPFHTPKYIAEFILPNIERGMRRAGRARTDIELASAVFVIAGDTPEELAGNRERIRQQIAFYASTPSYHPVFEIHGWKDAANQLSHLASRGQWGEMPKVVTDEMLAVFAEEGAWADVPAKVKKRYDGLLDRITYYLPVDDTGTDAQWRKTVEMFHA